MQQLDYILTSFRGKGFRITPQRVAIIHYLLNTELHPSAEDIYKIIQKKYPMVSMATIYKTLNSLEKMGIVQELGFADGSTRYESNIEKHINVVCVHCGRIQDINDEASLSELESRVIKKSKYQILSRRFELYGYCSTCKNKMNTKLKASYAKK